MYSIPQIYCLLQFFQDLGDGVDIAITVLQARKLKFKRLGCFAQCHTANK